MPGYLGKIRKSIKEALQAAKEEWGKIAPGRPFEPQRAAVSYGRGMRIKVDGKTFVEMSHFVGLYIAKVGKYVEFLSPGQSMVVGRGEQYFARILSEKGEVVREGMEQRVLGVFHVAQDGTLTFLDMGDGVEIEADVVMRPLEHLLEEG
ncbi:hypothetical protein DRN62_01920 [Nanoarchaeota archaeon]|nr:MAG: hypothetical protein DRN62_01920 [Nanoarchaeota archaeon]